MGGVCPGYQCAEAAKPLVAVRRPDREGLGLGLVNDIGKGAGKDGRIEPSVVFDGYTDDSDSRKSKLRRKMVDRFKSIT